jgi:hypothetical protein
MPWNDSNRITSAVALALSGIMESEILGVKASNDFVHTGLGGPMLKLQYDNELSMLKLDAFVPENFDLSIGQVLGVKKADGKESIIWSSKDQDEKSKPKFDGSF